MASEQRSRRDGKKQKKEPNDSEILHDWKSCVSINSSKEMWRVTGWGCGVGWEWGGDELRRVHFPNVLGNARKHKHSKRS